MKIVKFLILFLLLTVNFFAGTITATYTVGKIPSTLITSVSVSTNSRALNPGLLTVIIPDGAIITSVNVIYNMTATNLGYMSEQRSFILCSSIGGKVEAEVYSGGNVNSSGTFTYNRANLTIANNVIGGGNIQFELHAFRVYGSSGSDTTYNYVDNNTWQITINYDMPPDPPLPPTNLTAVAYTNQIQLSWLNNLANDNVIVAFNTTNTFGTPQNGTTYTLNNTINGSGTIIYNGSSTSCSHSNLNSTSQYFYKIWSVTGDNRYSIGITKDIMTNSIPIVSNVTFINNTPTTGNVDIYFDLTDAQQTKVTITMEVSNDGGATYTYECKQVTGDIGTDISVGSGKHIIWNFGREHSGVAGNYFKIKIIADNNVGDQVYYDGKIYNTVKIGSQIWLKENLDIGTMIQVEPNATNNGIIEKYCMDNNPANCTTYGGLYQWNEAMVYITTVGTKGICPNGWHIPTFEEFQTLKSTVNNNGNALKAIGQGTESGIGTNTSGFSALLAGERGTCCSFDSFGTGLFMSSTEAGTSVYCLFLYGSLSDLDIFFPSKANGLSVRCLKN